MILGRSRFSALPVVVFLAVAVSAVSGCTTTNNNPAPLAVPPDYTLRPPRPGVASTQQLSSTQQTQDTVFRIGDNKLDTLPPAKSRSVGETAFLEDAGAQNVPKDIRQLVNNDERNAADSNTLTERLLSWHQPAATAANAGPKPTIDAAKKDTGTGFFDWLL